MGGGGRCQEWRRREEGEIRCGKNRVEMRRENKRVDCNLKHRTDWRKMDEEKHQEVSSSRKKQGRQEDTVDGGIL